MRLGKHDQNLIPAMTTIRLMHRVERKPVLLIKAKQSMTGSFAASKEPVDLQLSLKNLTTEQRHCPLFHCL